MPAPRKGGSGGARRAARRAGSPPRGRGRATYALGAAVVAAAAAGVALWRRWASGSGGAVQPRPDWRAMGWRKPDFRGWPARAQVKAVENVGLIHRERWGYAVQAQGPIAANKSILSLPPSAVLTVDGVLTGAGGLSALLADPTVEGEVRVIIDPKGQPGGDAEWARAVLALGLLAERAAGDRSRWYDWLEEALPREFRGDTWWGPGEVRCLPEWPRQARSRREAAAQALARAAAHLRGVGAARGWGGGGDPLAAVGYDDARWALAVVGSRSWWRPPPHRLALLPALDVADVRARQAGQDWRPLPRNAQLLFDDAGTVHLVTARALKKGEFVSIGPGALHETPSEQVGQNGVIDPAFTHVLSHLDLSSADPEHCRQSDLMLLRNGTATPRTVHCVERYREVGEQPEADRRAAVAKLLAFHGAHMARKWALPAGGPCSKAALGALPHGAEVAHLAAAHEEAFGAAAAAYGGGAAARGAGSTAA